MLVTLRGQRINKRTVVLYWNDEDDEKHSNVQLNSLLVHPIRFFFNRFKSVSTPPLSIRGFGTYPAYCGNNLLVKVIQYSGILLCYMHNVTHGMWKWNITTDISFHGRSTFSVGSRKLLCKICPLWLKKQLPFWKMKGEKTLNPDEEKW